MMETQEPMVQVVVRWETDPSPKNLRDIRYRLEEALDYIEQLRPSLRLELFAQLDKAFAAADELRACLEIVRRWLKIASADKMIGQLHTRLSVLLDWFSGLGKLPEYGNSRHHAEVAIRRLGKYQYRWYRYWYIRQYFRQ